MGTHGHHDWLWYRCSILGCGTTPLRARPHVSYRDTWTVGFVDGPVWSVVGPAPRCPVCGDRLEALAAYSEQGADSGLQHAELQPGR